MSSFTEPLIVKHINGKRWEVMKTFLYHVGAFPSKAVITIQAGFITDFASIPRLFWPVVGHPADVYGKAAVVHDYLYSTHDYTRKQSDKIFLEAMKVSGVPFWKRWTMYRAVRMFGWWSWKR